MKKKQAKRKDARSCQLCGRNYRLIKARAVGSATSRNETDDEAQARHERDPFCQAISFERFAEECGWLRVGNGAHVASIKQAELPLRSLFCNIDTDPYDGSRVLSKTSFAPVAVVEAVRVLSRVRVPPSERRELLALLSKNTKARRALQAAKRIAGVAAVREVARSIPNDEEDPTT